MRKRSLKNEASLCATRSAASRDATSRRRRPSADDVAEELRVEHLLGVVPLVERLGLVEPLVALEADERPPERLGRARARSVLPTPAGPFEEQRAVELKREPERERGRRVGEVAGAAERALELGGRPAAEQRGKRIEEVWHGNCGRTRPRYSACTRERRARELDEGFAGGGRGGSREGSGLLREGSCGSGECGQTWARGGRLHVDGAQEEHGAVRSASGGLRRAVLEGAKEGQK